MLQCWHSEACDRPTFSALVAHISGLLEPLADYLDFTAFGNSSQMTTEYGGETAPGNVELEQPCSFAYEVPISLSNTTAAAL